MEEEKVWIGLKIERPGRLIQEALTAHDWAFGKG